MNKYDICGGVKNKYLYYNILLVVLILFAGFRYRVGGDTIHYLDKFYHLYPSFEDFDWEEDFALGKDPLFILFNALIKSLVGRFYIVQLFHAAFVNILIFHYIKKHTPYIFAAVFFYFIMFYFLYNMEIMRASMSIVVALFANDYVLEKKWLKAIALYLISCFFHAQAIVIVLTPLLFFLRLNKKTIVFLCLVYVLALSILPHIEDYLLLMNLNDDIDAKAMYYYDAGDIGSESYSIITYLLGIMPYIIYPFVALLYLKKKKYQGIVMKLEPLVIVGLMFLIIQLVILRANRFVDYYRVYFALFYAEFFIYLIKDVHCVNRKFRAFAIFFPLYFLLLFGAIKGEGWRYFPYSSIFEKTVSEHREKERDGAPAANPNEY